MWKQKKPVKTRHKHEKYNHKSLANAFLRMSFARHCCNFIGHCDAKYFPNYLNKPEKKTVEM